MTTSKKQSTDVKISKRTSWGCGACGRVLPTKRAAKEHVRNDHA